MRKINMKNIKTKQIIIELSNVISTLDTELSTFYIIKNYEKEKYIKYSKIKKTYTVITKKEIDKTILRKFIDLKIKQHYS
jgi:hypothetical protein